MYVKLKGGPLDGRDENVIDGADTVYVRHPTKDAHCKYVRCKRDGAMFLYSGTRIR